MIPPAMNVKAIMIVVFAVGFLIFGTWRVLKCIKGEAPLGSTIGLILGAALAGALVFFIVEDFLTDKIIMAVVKKWLVEILTAPLPGS